MSFKNITGIIWLLLRVQSGAEIKIKNEIDEAFAILKQSVEEKQAVAEEVDLEDLVISRHLLSVYFPTIVTDVLMKDGTRKKQDKCAFSGYIFIQIDLTNISNSEKIITIILSFLRRVLKRISVVSSKNTGDLRILSQIEFEKMVSKIDEVSEKRKNSNQINIGSYVKILSGPFSSTKAVVIKVDYDANIVKVSFSIFGKEMFEQCRIEDVKMINHNEEDDIENL